jgi:hypothetical protein
VVDLAAVCGAKQEGEIMTQQGWTATGVIEAPLERVSDVLLTATEGPIGTGNAPLLRAVPGAGRLLGNATLRGGPRSFTLHYGLHPGGKVEVDPAHGYFRFEGGYKFSAEYRFTPHPKGTFLTYRAINVAPADHQNRAAVRFQFWLGGKLKIGLRSGLRRMGKALGCRAYPSS